MRFSSQIDTSWQGFHNTNDVILYTKTQKYVLLIEYRMTRFAISTEMKIFTCSDDRSSCFGQDRKLYCSSNVLHQTDTVTYN